MHLHNHHEPNCPSSTTSKELNNKNNSAKRIACLLTFCIVCSQSLDVLLFIKNFNFIIIIIIFWILFGPSASWALKLYYLLNRPTVAVHTLNTQTNTQVSQGDREDTHLIIISRTQLSIPSCLSTMWSRTSPSPMNFTSNTLIANDKNEKLN